MKKIKIYMAGSLFTPYEQEARKKEAKETDIVCKREFPKLEFEVSAPVNFKINEGDKKSGSAIEIFQNDYNEVSTADYVFADLSNVSDLGVAMEMGIAIQRKTPIFAYYDDIRLNLKNETNDPYQVGLGFNLFVIGGIYYNNKRIYLTFADALAAFVERIRKDCK